MYRSYEKELELLTDEQLGRLIRALLHFLNHGEETELPSPECYLWPRFREQHLRDADHYTETCQRNRANGIKGGKAKAERIRKRADATLLLASASKSDESAHFLASASEGDESVHFVAVAPKEREKEKEKEREKEKHTITECGVSHYPSKEEVLVFCNEEGLEYVDAERFVAYYSSIGWVIKGQPIKDWRAAARLWNQRERAKIGEQNGLEGTWNACGNGIVL